MHTYKTEVAHAPYSDSGGVGGMAFWRVVGAEHIDTAASCNDIGALLKRLGRQKEALPYYTRALAIRKQVLGPDHPHTMESCGEVGYSLKQLGRHQDALQYYTQALSIAEQLNRSNADGYRTLIESCHGASSATAASAQASSSTATGDASRSRQIGVSAQRPGRLLPRSMQADAIAATEASDDEADLPEGENTLPARSSRRKCVVM